MPKNDFEVIISNEGVRTSRQQKSFEGYMASHQISEINNLLNRPEIHDIPERLKKVTEKLITFYQEEYKKLGLDINTKDILVLEIEEQNKIVGTTGTVDIQTGAIIIDDYGMGYINEINLTEEDELTLRYKAKIIAHELYHKFGQRIFFRI